MFDLLLDNYLMVTNTLAVLVIFWRASNITAHMTWHTNHLVRLAFAGIAVCALLQVMQPLYSFATASWSQIGLNMGIAAMLLLDRRQRLRQQCEKPVTVGR